LGERWNGRGGEEGGRKEGRRDGTRAFPSSFCIFIELIVSWLGVWRISVSFESARELLREREDGEGRKEGWFGGRRWVLRR